ncbi:hypothetical protein [Micromonospora aurantiaca (nom. illeg.)]|uniref:hypothetical protein n=1 Tax=Micromonospora aurantiaca (nom. illeg.) TaxID=47850 RepID=UPI00119D4E50|nr:hypothetical protein [Micromonospora aurantiaca]MBC9000445.1 hypothetical protein [Micromonospora aurantiaca]
MQQQPTTDLGARIRAAVDAPLHPAALAATVCTAIAEQFELYALHEGKTAKRHRDAGSASGAAHHDGTATAYTRAATQMRDLARRLTAAPADTGLWAKAITTTPEPYREFFRQLTDAEGSALAQAGMPLEPTITYVALWEQHIWPAIVADLDELIREHGGAIAARIDAGQPA